MPARSLTGRPPSAAEILHMRQRELVGEIGVMAEGGERIDLAVIADIVIAGRAVLARVLLARHKAVRMSRRSHGRMRRRCAELAVREIGEHTVPVEMVRQLMRAM